MQIKLEQLETHLARNTLTRRYLVFGDDPFLTQHALDTLRAVCQQQGFTERIPFVQNKEFKWESLLAQTQNMSLFSDKQLIELELPEASPGREGAQALTHFLQQQTPNQILIVHGKQVTQATQRTKWFKSLLEQGTFIPIYTPRKHEFPRYIQQRARTLGIQLHISAVDFLSQYFEGNLLALEQELVKLKLQTEDDNKVWQAEALQAIISDQSRFNIFAIRDTLLAQDLPAYLHCLERLQEADEAPVLILWHLSKLQSILNQLTTAISLQQPTQNIFNAERIWQQQQNSYLNLARHYSKALNHHLVTLVERADLAIKAGTGESVFLLFAHFGVALLQPQNFRQLNFILQERVMNDVG